MPSTMDVNTGKIKAAPFTWDFEKAKGKGRARIECPIHKSRHACEGVIQKEDGLNYKIAHCNGDRVKREAYPDTWAHWFSVVLKDS